MESSKDFVLDKLDVIITQLDRLETEIAKRLDKLETEIQYVKQGNDNMTEHISFVENVYDTIKNPFYYVINKIKPIARIPEKPKSLTQS